MRVVRTILAAIGLCALLAAAAAAWTFRGFDAQAGTLYWSMARTLAATGNIAEATVWKRPVAAGLSFEEVDESIRSLGARLNIRDVGALPLGDQVTAMRGAPWRKLKVYLFCNPLTAAEMIDYSEAYSAWLPCRVSLVEDGAGRLWLYTLNMDLMIHGGRPLPGPLGDQAAAIRTIIAGLLDKAATGEF